MNRSKITDAVKDGRILISDGAWGHFSSKKVCDPESVRNFGVLIVRTMFWKLQRAILLLVLI